MFFTDPFDAISARLFLGELHQKGLLFHPEGNPERALQGHDLPPAELAAICAKMRACYDHLADPAAYAVGLFAGTIH